MARRPAAPRGLRGAAIADDGPARDRLRRRVLDEAWFDPFWQRLEELQVPLYLHPRQLAAGQREIMAARPELAGAVWEFGVDCSASALRLMASGLFDRHPGVQVVLGHLGEGLPYDIGRIENRMKISAHRTALRRSPTQYLREDFHVTKSGHFSTPSLQAAISVMGIDRVLFSVDYPYESTEEATTWFDSLELGDADRQAIGAENAVRLLGLKPGAPVGMTTVRFVAADAEPGPAAIHTDTVDLNGRYLAWFSALGVDTVVVRPDFYVYAATGADELRSVLETLADQLDITDSAPVDAILPERQTTTAGRPRQATGATRP